MSEPRSNQASQAGMAILMIVVLLGALFLGVGGWAAVRIRAQRAAAEDAMRMAEQAHYEAERTRAEAEKAREQANEALSAETP